MNIFNRVANWVAGRTGEKHPEAGLLSQINDVRQVLESVAGILNNPEAVAAFVSGLDVTSTHQHARYLSGAAYHAYLDKTSMKITASERRHPLSSLETLVFTGISDLTALTRRTDLLGANDDGSEERLSALIVAGYVQSLSDLGEWLYYLFRLSDEYRADGSKSGSWFKVPPVYVKHKVADLITPVSALANEIFSRKPKQDFVSLLDKLISSGRNLKLTADGHSIADYANEKTYEASELNYTSMGMINPFALYGTEAMLRRRAYYNRNKAIRDWLATKVARFSLDAASTDPESPEYARLIKISQNYADLVAQYDKDLEKHADKY